MTLFPRGINIDQLSVRSHFGCLFVNVSQENAYNLVIFSARKMFLHFSCTEFNEEFSSTIRFYLVTQFC